MPYLDLLAAQLMDPFRIALLVALVFTMQRNRVVTGTFVPLLAGMLFVAVIIPATISPPDAGWIWPVAAVGMIANAIIVAAIIAIWAMVRRARG